MSRRAGAAQPNFFSGPWKVIGSTFTAISIVNLIQHIHRTPLANSLSEFIGFYRSAIRPITSFCAQAINAGLALLPLKLHVPLWYQEWLTLSAIGSTLLLRALVQDQHVFRSARRKPVLYAKSLAVFAITGVLYSVTLLGLVGLVIALVGMTFNAADKKTKDRTVAAAGECGWATLFAVAVFYIVNQALQMNFSAGRI